MAGPATRTVNRERDIVRMTIFYVSSLNPLGVTVTTRHYLPTAVETEKLRRALAGHTGIAVQEGAQTCALPWPCVKRTVRPLPHLGGRRHA